MSFIAQDAGNLSSDADASGRVNDWARGNYMLAHHSSDWQLDADGRLIPVLVCISREVGSGSVSKKGGFRLKQMEHEQHGFTMIPHDVLGSKDYVVMYYNKKGQPVHRSIFQTPEDGLDGTTWRVNERAKDRFIELLRQRRIIKPPTPSVVSAHLATKRNRYSEKIKRGPRNTTAESLLRYDTEMQKLRETIERLEVELAASEAHYGAKTAPVDDLLDSLLSDEMTQVEAVAPLAPPAAPRKKSQKSGFTATAPDHTEAD